MKLQTKIAAFAASTVVSVSLLATSLGSAQAGETPSAAPAATAGTVVVDSGADLSTQDWLSDAITACKVWVKARFPRRGRSDNTWVREPNNTPRIADDPAYVGGEERGGGHNNNSWSGRPAGTLEQVNGMSQGRMHDVVEHGLRLENDATKGAFIKVWSGGKALGDGLVMGSCVPVGNARMEGTVKWFNAEKGFGFITVNGGVSSGEDIFVHFSSIEGGGFKTLNPGQRVSFSTVTNKKGISANAVRKI